MNNTNNSIYDQQEMIYNKFKNSVLRYLDLNLWEKSFQQIVLRFMRVVNKYPVESLMVLLFLLNIMVLFMVFRNYFNKVMEKIDNITVYTQQVSNLVIKNDYDEVVDDVYTRMERLEDEVVDFMKKDKNFGVIKQIKDILNKDERSMKKINMIERLLKN